MNKNSTQIIYAPEGGVARSDNGATLRSNGHIVCYNIIIFNLETRAALMLHVFEQKFHGLNEEQLIALNNFRKVKGEKTAVIIEGNKVQRRLISESEFCHWNIKLTGTHTVDELFWDAIFNSETRRLTVLNQRGKHCYSKILFAKYPNNKFIQNVQNRGGACSI